MKKFVLFTFLPVLLPVFVFTQSYSINLNIINMPNENGQAVIIAGDAVLSIGGQFP